MDEGYRFAEWLMYHYRENVKLRDDFGQVLTEMLVGNDVHGQEYGLMHDDNGTHSDPVSSWYMRVERVSREYERYMWYAGSVEYVRGWLDSNIGVKKYAEMRGILESVYIGGESTAQYAVRNGQSERTVYRRRRELVRLTELGIKELREKRKKWQEKLENVI